VCVNPYSAPQNRTVSVTQGISLKNGDDAVDRGGATKLGGVTRRFRTYIYMRAATSVIVAVRGSVIKATNARRGLSQNSKGGIEITERTETIILELRQLSEVNVIR
jgi:hypothetical protein